MSAFKGAITLYELRLLLLLSMRLAKSLAAECCHPTQLLYH